MRRLIRSTGILVLAWALTSSLTSGEQVKWQTDLDSAFEMARQLNRPLLIHFWSPDCGPCLRLDETVFNRASVSETIGDFFVAVKVNAKELPNVAARYRIESLPKDVIVSASGQELHRMQTPQSPQQYIAQLSAVAFRSGLGPQPSSASSTQPLIAPDAAGRTNPVDTSTLTNRQPPASSNYVAAASAGGIGARGPTGDSGQISAGSPVDASGGPQEVINRFARRNSPAEKPTGPYSGLNTAALPQGSSQEPRGYDPVRSGQPSSEAVSNRGVLPVQRELGSAPDLAAGRPGPVQPTVPDRGAPPTQSPPTGPVATPSGGPGTPPLGLDGYCPVTLLKTDAWKQGDPRYGVIHRGRLYLFTSAEEKQAFFANPDDYSPVLAGIDPVQLSDSGEAVEGRRAHGVVYRKRVYLFVSEENLQRFWQQPERYAAPIREAMETGTVGRLFR